MSNILGELIRCGVPSEVIEEVANLMASVQYLTAQADLLDRQRQMAADRQKKYRGRNVTATSRNVTPPSIEGKKVRKKRSDRGVPLPDDFEPDRAYALEKGVDASKIELEFERFKNHARANGRLQVDWQGAWRNWVTSPYQTNGGRNGTNGSGHAPRNGSREHRQERTANAIAALADYPGGGSRHDEVPVVGLPLFEPHRS